MEFPSFGELKNSASCPLRQFAAWISFDRDCFTRGGVIYGSEEKVGT
jgi:hypothetical protein